MSWIKEIPQTEAEGDLQKIYATLANERGKVSNIMSVQSLNPGAMRHHLRLYGQLMFASSGLSREEREMIAVVVSTTNHCDYCISHHDHALQQLRKQDSETGDETSGEPTPEHSVGREAAMLGYARKLTVMPYSVTSEDIDQLRSNGFNDKDILDINLIVAYFNFVNRIALGLGVEFTEQEVTGYKL